jgi:hypothetical protein
MEYVSCWPLSSGFDCRAASIVAAAMAKQSFTPFSLHA